MTKKYLFLLWLLSFCTFYATDTKAENAGDTIVSMVICDAGSNVYELEGHAALRVRMPGNDVAVHWGLFDFNAPGFVWRFALGQTDYMCGAAPWPWFVEAYRRNGRRVTEHRLDLTSAEKQRLVETLSDNLLPENAVYRYNYVRDNCSTRPLRTIEAAIGDTLLLPDPAPAQATFRDIMRACHENYPWYQFGIDLALGPGIDGHLSAREKAFAPVLLEQQLAGARTASGRRLVDSTSVIVEAAPRAAVLAPTPWLATPMAVALLVLAAAVAVTIRDIRRRSVCRIFDTALYGLFGMAGCLVFFLAVFSTHEATSPNFLLAWVNPLCLLPVVFIWIKKAQRLVLCYQIANFAVLLALSLAWPLLHQSANAAFWPLIAADAVRAANYIMLNRPCRK